MKVLHQPSCVSALQTLRRCAATVALGLVLTLASVQRLDAGPNATLELQTSRESFQGRLLRLGDDVCELLGRDGRIHLVNLNDVKSFREINSQFTPMKSAELRDELRREFGKGFEVAGSEHYLVCAPHGKAKVYVQVFEEVYRGFRGYFSTRGFRMDKPEFPLVAVVFSSPQEFLAYLKQDRVPASPGLQGYYLPASNRVVLFERGPSSAALPANHQSIAAMTFPPGANEPRAELLPTPADWDNLLRSPHASIRSNGNVNAELRDIMIHEATHQAAFNTGLHSRTGANPRWIVEGLATVFEAPGIRNSQRTGSVASRINRERYLWFRNFAKQRRQPNSLREFVANDSLYQSATLDFYSQAWALSFFLVETRPSEYARYLRKVAEHDWRRPYSERERLDDFEAAFGGDLNLLDAKFLRFIEQIE